MERYDVFISFKNTDKNGRTTRDAAMAEALYRALKQKGISVFFSKYSISEAARADYVDAIDNALEDASVFVAVGTSRENLTSGWVKHEINQFRAMLNEGDGKKRSIVSYRSIEFSPNDLPSGLRCYQSYDDQKSVVRFVEACLQKASGFRNDGDGTVLLYENDVTGPLQPNVSAPAPSRGLQFGTVLDGRYEILSLIGRGGMSSVYLATDRRLAKQFAVKEIRFDNATDIKILREGLSNEVELMRRLDHPAIPKIYDILDSADSLIVVMEYVEGNNLNKLLSEGGPFPEETALDIARQLCQVLEHLHERPSPIIYRDLKPANIMLRPDGKVKLIDFGAAREHKQSAFGDTTCLGTVGYAAPEQFGGMGQTDSRTDIYNLGATLYQMVTGKNPAQPPYEILPVRQINSGLSRGLEMIIQKCTQKDPQQRFQSAKELLDALDHIDKLGKFSWVYSVFGNGKARKKNKNSNKRKAQTENSAPFRIPGQSTPAPQPMAPQPLVIKPPVAPPIPMPSVPAQNDAFHSALTEELEEVVPDNGTQRPMPVETVPPIWPTPPLVTQKPNARKVTVRPKTPTNRDRELETTVAKLTALDPKSQQIVRDLIDRLSE